MCVVNPLGGALRHYTDALVEVVTAAGASVVRYEITEPSSSGSSRYRWLRQYIGMLRRARTERSVLTIVTWPVLGYFDLVLLRLFRSRAGDTVLVVHDPEPLVPSIGHGAVGRVVARRVGPEPRLLVHGDEALSALDRHGLADRASVLPHPVRRREHTDDARPTHTRPIVRVLGSWKEDRDMEVLQALGALMSERLDLEIHGRGWPSIPGWTVADRFLAEQEFDELVRTASVVLVPYRRVFQSGIAVRALELGTPFIGPRVSAHEDLYPDLPDLLVDVDLDTTARVSAWVTAIRSAVALPDDVLRSTAAAAVDAAAAGWTALVERSHA